MTLQEIAASTKISSRALQALEDEHFDQLPGGIFNKGFVRAYARCVGLDEEKMLAEYLAAAKVTPSEIDMEVMSTQVAAAAGKPQPWAPSAASVVGVLAVLVALGMGGLWWKEHRKEARDQAASQAASAAPPAASPVIPPPQTTAVAPDSAVPSPQGAANGGELNANQGASKDTNQDMTAPAPANPAPNITAGAASSSARSAAASLVSGEQAAGTSAPVQVSISATERVWISVRSDGKTVETLTLDPENPETRSRSYTANEKLLLVVGNPAGLSATYNGKPTGVLGLRGQRARITFTPEGMDKQ